MGDAAGEETPQTPVLAVGCRVLRSPSHESVTTDLSLFSVSSSASEAHNKRSQGGNRGHSPYPDSRRHNRVIPMVVQNVNSGEGLDAFEILGAARDHTYFQRGEKIDNFSKFQNIETDSAADHCYSQHYDNSPHVMPEISENGQDFSKFIETDHCYARGYASTHTSTAAHLQTSENDNSNTLSNSEGKTLTNCEGLAEGLAISQNCTQYSNFKVIEETNIYDILEESTLELINEGPFEKSSKTQNEIEEAEIIRLQKEYESIMEYPLEVEVDHTEPTVVLPGNRIVDLDYVLGWALKLQVDHSKICTCGKLYIWKEERIGLISKIFFKCTMCNRILVKTTAKPEKSVLSKPVHRLKVDDFQTNVSAVWGTLATGSCYSHLEELCCAMEIPPLNYPMFHKIEEMLGDAWHDEMVTKFSEAGKEERALALQKNHVDSQGTPYITVYVDGGWSKRSYGHNYTALSGSAIIIGKETKKVLFLGIRNKFCYVCALAFNKQKTPKEHRCFRNWSGSSPAMEADIILEGFNQSLELHGLKYKYFIGDGDSSTFATLKLKCSYGQEIQKLECTNHLFKNYSKHLYNIKDDKRVNCPKIFNVSKIKELVDVAKLQTSHNHKYGSVEELKSDLANGPKHVFGNHQYCKEYYCHNKETITDTMITELKRFGVFHRVESCVNNVIKKADHLLNEETNNRAELYMSLVAKYISGKRINYNMKGSYQTRCAIASMQYNEGPEWQLNTWKSIARSSPGKNLKRLVNKRRRILGYARSCPKTCRKSLFIKNLKSVKMNTDYGANAIQPELSEQKMNEECERLIKQMAVTLEERNEIERNTVGQFGNLQYEAERKNRLTASLFGKIIKRKPWTSCHNNVKSVLYNTSFYSEAIEYGKINESAAINKFSKEYGVPVKRCGIFIDLQHCFLAASPDGLIENEGLVEVKCLHSVFKSGLSLFEAIQNKDVCRNICLEIVDGQIQLKRKHDYYYQKRWLVVMGQFAQGPDTE